MGWRKKFTHGKICEMDLLISALASCLFLKSEKTKICMSHFRTGWASSSSPRFFFTSLGLELSTTVRKHSKEVSYPHNHLLCLGKGFPFPSLSLVLWVPCCFPVTHTSLPLVFLSKRLHQAGGWGVVWLSGLRLYLQGLAWHPGG